jgi:hypothetical protein
MLASGRRRPITELIRDASDLYPEITKCDSLVFTANVGANGLLTAQIPMIRIPSDFDFSFYGLRGWAQDYATFADDAARVTFNVRESGRNQDIFPTTDQQMAALVTPGGPANDLIFPERTLLRAGSELTARMAIAAGWNKGARLLGFVMFGQMIAAEAGRK